jgi:Domain of unknown function (DUF4333)
MRSPRLLTIVALTLPCAFIVNGCSASVGGDNTVSASAAEKQIKTQLAPRLPQPVKSVSCPGDLDSKVGKSENCVLTYESGQKVQVRVTITKVDGDNVRFNMLVTKVL